jgi:hypothetical protein
MQLKAQVSITKPAQKQYNTQKETLNRQKTIWQQLGKSNINEILEKNP